MPEFRANDVATWSQGVWKGKLPNVIRGVSIDTRTLQPGELYVALKGEHHDGHDFLEQAFKQGAAGALVSRESKTDKPLLVVPDTKKALWNLAQGYRATLPMEVVAVSGSVGKTTVKEMIADVLAQKASTARSKGNWNNDIGTPLSLLEADPDDRFGIFEVGMNHPGELAPLCELIKPTHGVLTAIGPVHLEYFDSEEAIAREKAMVLESLPKSGTAFLCRDDKWFDVVRKYVPGRLVTTSLFGDADYVGAMCEDAMHFTVTEKQSGDQIEFVSPLVGAYAITDALLAIAVGRQYGIAWKKIVDAIKNYKPLPFRWNTVRMGGIEFVNDAYNANPLSMRAALKAFEQMASKGKKWLVLAGMRELGKTEKEEHVALGREIAAGNWAGLVVIGKAGGWIADGVGDVSFKTVRCKEIGDAVETLQQHVGKGDAVLLKASRGEHLEEILKGWRMSRTNEARATFH